MAALSTDRHLCEPLSNSTTQKSAKIWTVSLRPIVPVYLALTDSRIGLQIRPIYLQAAREVIETLWKSRQFFSMRRLPIALKRKTRLARSTFNTTLMKMRSTPWPFTVSKKTPGDSTDWELKSVAIQVFQVILQLCQLAEIAVRTKTRTRRPLIKIQTLMALSPDMTHRHWFTHTLTHTLRSDYEFS